MGQSVKAVLFDLDDTLYARERTFLAWARWFTRERLGIVDDSAEAVVAEIIALDARGYTARDALFGRLKDDYPCLTEEVERLVAAFSDQHATFITTLDQEAADLLDALCRAGLPWGIITNGSPTQWSKVRKLGLERLTSCVFVSGEFGVHKPDPAIFHAAAARLGVEPRDVLFVGDNPGTDITGAIAAGMQAAWLHRGRPWPEHVEAVTPHYVVDSLAELTWVLG